MGTHLPARTFLGRPAAGAALLTAALGCSLFLGGPSAGASPASIGDPAARPAQADAVGGMTPLLRISPIPDNQIEALASNPAFNLTAFGADDPAQTLIVPVLGAPEKEKTPSIPAAIVQAVTTTVGRLAFTGTPAVRLLFASGLLFLGGVLFLLAGKRRRRSRPTPTPDEGP